MRIPAYTVRQSGLSLVELMVGMLVGLIGIVIISHLYVTNEQYKRSTTGSGAAQVNGAIALYSVERDLRMAGYGINSSKAFTCACDTATNPKCSPLQYFYNGIWSDLPGDSVPPRVGLLARTIAPVLITKTLVAPFTPDAITVLYSGDNERATPNTMTQTMSTPFDYNADGTAGFEDGNIVVVTQDANCALSQITVDKDNSQLKRPVSWLYNPPGNDKLPTFSKGASIFNLGGNPVWRTYEIVGNKLRVTNALPPGTAGQDLVDDIVDMQALYGKDTDNPPDGVVDVYDGNTPKNSLEWGQVVAVRIAVAARSQNYEKPTVPPGSPPGTAPSCQATTTAPTWGPRAGTPAVGTLAFPKLAADLAGAVNDAGCYKYRVFETIVPLRNMIWRSS